jgi:hypothetical protein
LIRADSRDSRACPTYSHGRGLPWLQLKAGRRGNSHGGTEGSAGGSVPHIHICRPLQKTLHPTEPVRARDGAFAPEAWVGSAIQPYPFFSIRADSRDSRASPTYSHGRGLPWLQLKAGRRGNSHGGTEARRGKSGDPDFET